MIKPMPRRVFTGTALASVFSLGLAGTLSTWAPTASARASALTGKSG